MRTLVLNAGYEPLAIVSFRRALVLVMNQKASIVEIDTGHPVWGTDGPHDRPAVIVLSRYVKIPTSRRVPVTRRGVLRRDANRCGYCGTTASTIDHILPRSRVICTRRTVSHHAHGDHMSPFVVRPRLSTIQGRRLRHFRSAK